MTAPTGGHGAAPGGDRLTPTAVRRIFLARQQIGRRPRRGLPASKLAALVEALGFVQVDSIDTLARAHHAILFARHAGYRPETLTRALETKRLLFEGWTHDAAILPVAFWPVWCRHFVAEEARLARHWRDRHDLDADGHARELLRRIADGGPLKARDLAPPDRRAGGWWNWHPGKAALEFLWRTGRLAVTRREGFEKVFDLAERVIPDDIRSAPVPGRDGLIDWACAGALDRLGTATAAELAAYWGLISLPEAKAWAEAAIAEGRAIPIEVAGTDTGARRADKRSVGPSGARMLASPDALASPPPPPPRGMRVLSPFDPCLRDRKRARRLFDFDYRIEVFVPAAQRRYGYYVFPLMEGERMVARIDMQADRRAGVLRVREVFWEPALRVTPARRARLAATLSEMAVWAGLDPEIIQG